MSRLDDGGDVQGDVRDQKHQDDPHIQEEGSIYSYKSKEREGGMSWHQVVKVVQELVRVDMINIMQGQREHKDNVFRRRLCKHKWV